LRPIPVIIRQSSKPSSNESVSSTTSFHVQLPVCNVGKLCVIPVTNPLRTNDKGKIRFHQ
jgi:hypothetical protein